MNMLPPPTSQRGTEWRRKEAFIFFSFFNVLSFFYIIQTKCASNTTIIAAETVPRRVKMWEGQPGREMTAGSISGIFFF